MHRKPHLFGWRAGHPDAFDGSAADGELKTFLLQHDDIVSGFSQTPRRRERQWHGEYFDVVQTVYDILPGPVPSRSDVVAVVQFWMTHYGQRYNIQRRKRTAVRRDDGGPERPGPHGRQRRRMRCGPPQSTGGG